MQDEVAKHTKKIYHAMKDPKHNFWEKVKEVTIEIFIIVFAVTLSIWFHNWSDHRHEQNEKKEFLLGLKNDLVKDIRLLEDSKKTFVRVKKNFDYITALNDNKTIDTVSEKTLSDRFDIQLRATHPNIGRYEGFKSSGKIGNIEEDSLKQEILVYYQQTMPGVQDVEGIVNSLQTKVLDLLIDRDYNTTLRSRAKSLKIRALLALSADNLHSAILAYEDAITQAKRIISMIDKGARK